MSGVRGRRSFQGGLTLLALLLVLAGCGASRSGSTSSGTAPAAGGTSSAGQSQAGQPKKELSKIRFGYATKAISPIIINILIPEYLGFYAEEGLTVEAIPLGSNAAVMAALGKGEVEFGVGVPSFQLPLAAQGEKVPSINFYEYTYPFKWGVAVSPNSSVQKLEDLKGKTIGVANLGTTDYPVGKALFSLVGINPDKDITWLAVGEGVTAGQALQRGNIAALVYFDTGFGQIEAAGITMRYLSLPQNTPKVGGLYLAATRDMLTKHRDWSVGFARAVAKGSLFVESNPDAAAYGYLKMFPEAAPRASSVKEQVDAVLSSVRKRVPLYRHYDKSVTRWGDTLDAEWRDEAVFLGLADKFTSFKDYYTTELIDEINKFDQQAVVEKAKGFKLPY